MSHFAHVNNGIVDSVIVIEQEVLDANNGWCCPSCGEHKPLSEWVQTSYNTQRGEYTKGSDPKEKLSLKAVGTKSDIDARNRKNFAGVGYIYDKKRDAFIPPKKHASWILNEDSCQYEPPVPMPQIDINTESIDWDESTTSWVITPRN